jgi:hypothetical protein
MHRKRHTAFLALIFLIIIYNPLFAAQETDEDFEALRQQAPYVFIDCYSCDIDYFRDNLTYVNFVRDRTDADVHVLVTSQHTGSGGDEYTFAFIGLGKFQDMTFTMVHSTGPSATRDEVRSGQLTVMKRGLTPYMLETPLSQFLEVDFKRRFKSTSVADPWKYWVFSISTDGRFRGESTQRSRNLDLNISANKVTPDIKIRLGLSGEFDRETYEYEDETIVSSQDEKNFTGMFVKSFGEHWSVGGWVEAETSTYGNMEMHLNLSPAVEYNFFPYSESTRRQLLARYRVGWNSFNYYEETLYNKMKESLLNESLTIMLQLKEPWGTISTSLEGSHFFHDFKRNRMALSGSIDVRLFRGLSFEVRGRYGMIRDQLALPKGEATLDEVLLSRKELATNYDYSFSIGLRYTFGSVFSNVVNPRFGQVRNYH